MPTLFHCTGFICLSLHDVGQVQCWPVHIESVLPNVYRPVPEVQPVPPMLLYGDSCCLADATCSDLKQCPFILQTNNPRKISTLQSLGVQVLERIPCIVKAQKYSEGYLKVKQSRMSHVFDGSFCHWNHGEPASSCKALTVTSPGQYWTACWDPVNSTLHDELTFLYMLG